MTGPDEESSATLAMAHSSVRQAREVRRLRPSFVGLGLVAAAFFLDAASGLFLRLWTVGLLLGCWLLGTVVAMVFFVRRPRFVLLLGVLELAVWCAVVLAVDLG